MDSVRWGAGIEHAPMAVHPFFHQQLPLPQGGCCASPTLAQPSPPSRLAPQLLGDLVIDVAPRRSGWFLAVPQPADLEAPALPVDHGGFHEVLLGDVGVRSHLPHIGSSDGQVMDAVPVHPGEQALPVALAVQSSDPLHLGAVTPAAPPACGHLVHDRAMTHEVKDRAERRRQAVELRAQGHTLAEIGAALRITRQGVWKLLQAARREAQRSRASTSDADAATPETNPVEAVSAPQGMTVRVPTRINPLTQWAEEEVECESAEAADGWDATKWRSWP